ncbi:hypothetical protein SCLCIDRAFT_104057 [Scleroderma citrinum Foug A]|uniref:RPA43 OB domain-containing protein n=1 Tax=Scleroderma citrinum Foug A TaxID=1036808 RepID=A0A0C3EM83_9AGAM|nr:hypothetical protein SCLCIDRAFT_104057 [Scleroderma citrinum Foug A]
MIENPKSKKQKHAETVDSSSPKIKKKKRDKSRVSSRGPSEFCIINATTVLSIPPVFSSDLRAGVEEMLDSMIMRYIPSLQGVLLAYSNTQLLGNSAAIRGDCPFAICSVGFDATVWCPRVSMKLVGKINLCSPDHVSLLVHRIFNVSIPRHHIPQDQWTFEYGPAENDPEFGAGRAEAQGHDETPNASGDSSGQWAHHLTGEKLGSPDGYLEFTVIGLTVANEMLSLQGSIQPDPFSPEHVPHRPSDSRASTPSSHASYHPYVTATGSQSRIPVNGDGDVSADEEEEDQFGEDTFMDLVRLEREEAAKQRREAERIEKKTKKRKRREEEVTADNVKAGASADDGKKTGKREKKKHKKSKTMQDTT